MALRAIHLCSGYGGFELALRPFGVRTVAHVERDAYAAATLVARMAETRLDQAPVWDDLVTFDGRPWRGRVDLITAGFPCQPFSAAGKRLGTDDDRWLWPDIARIIRDVEPRYVFLENVPGVVRAGLTHVLGDLAALGFDAEWGLLSAAAVGAPHRRERWWCLAYTDRDGLARFGRQPEHDRHARDDVDRPGGADVAEPTVARREGRRVRQHQSAERGADVGHAASVGCGQGQRPDTHQPEGRQSNPQVASHQWPPYPDDLDGWARWTAEGGAQPSIRRSTDGTTDWLADALHLGGNGLVPQCATEAFRQLVGRAMNHQGNPPRPRPQPTTKGDPCKQ